jgi:putative phosphoesterase
MIRIGLLSDTHGYLDDKILEHFQECEEIWHAGDIGDGQVAKQLSAFRPLRAVYGNIDSREINTVFPEQDIFQCEEVKVMIRHITGYPGKYDPLAKKEIELHQPDLLIAGHSHILRIMYDEQHKCLFMNPGAAGHHGLHLVRTLVRFTIDGKAIRDAEVVELGKRGR